MQCLTVLHLRHNATQSTVSFSPCSLSINHLEPLVFMGLMNSTCQKSQTQWNWYHQRPVFCTGESIYTSSYMTSHQILELNLIGKAIIQPASFCPLNYKENTKQKRNEMLHKVEEFFCWQNKKLAAAPSKALSVVNWWLILLPRVHEMHQFIAVCV